MLNISVGGKKYQIKLGTVQNKIVFLQRKLRIEATLRSDFERQLAHDSR